MEPIDDGVRRNLYEIISDLYPIDPLVELGFRPEDLNTDWQADALKYPAEKDVDDFLKKYKQNFVVEEENDNDDDENIVFSEEQQEVIDILNLQIDQILGFAIPSDKGNTIHSTFKLQTVGYNCDALEGTAAAHFENEHEQAKFFIVDEMSMIRAHRICQIENRCRQLRPQINEPFGGFFVYFLGDFRQLPPVMDTPLFEPNPKTIDKSRGIEIFKSFDRFVELQISHRQQHNSRFSQLLDRLAKGSISDLDYEIFRNT